MEILKNIDFLTNLCYTYIRRINFLFLFWLPGTVRGAALFTKKTLPVQQSLLNFTHNSFPFAFSTSTFSLMCGASCKTVILSSQKAISSAEYASSTFICFCFCVGSHRTKCIQLPSSFSIAMHLSETEMPPAEADPFF